jgi:hypothetical protein
MTTRTAGPLAAVLTVLVVLIAGCAPPPLDPNHLVVWTLENLPERLAAIRSVADSLAANELLDPAATGRAPAALGPETFSARALADVTAAATKLNTDDVAGSFTMSMIR